MNIDQINSRVFRFRLHNLLGVCDGHYDILVDIETMLYVISKHADYGNLVSYIPTNDTEVLFPTEEQDKLLRKYVIDAINQAYYYDYDKIHGKGKYLLDKLEEKCEKDPITNKGTEWFKDSNGKEFRICKENLITRDTSWRFVDDTEYFNRVYRKYEDKKPDVIAHAKLEYRRDKAAVIALGAGEIQSVNFID